MTDHMHNNILHTTTVGPRFSDILGGKGFWSLNRPHNNVGDIDTWCVWGSHQRDRETERQTETETETGINRDLIHNLLFWLMIMNELFDFLFLNSPRWSLWSSRVKGGPTDPSIPRHVWDGGGGKISSKMIPQTKKTSSTEDRQKTDDRRQKDRRQTDRQKKTNFNSKMYIVILSLLLVDRTILDNIRVNPLECTKPFPPRMSLNRGPTVCIFTFKIKLDWTAIKTEAKIPWDLEKTPLQIKTDSTLGSNEQMFVNIYDKDNVMVGNLAVFFGTWRYKMVPCTGDINTWAYFPHVGGHLYVFFWTFTKTGTALTIRCNGVNVLNYQFADSPHGGCVTKMGGDVVEQIQFPNWATASDYYWTEREREREREREKATERQRERESDRETERQSQRATYLYSRFLRNFKQPSHWSSVQCDCFPPQHQTTIGQYSDPDLVTSSGERVLVTKSGWPLNRGPTVFYCPAITVYGSKQVTWPASPTGASFTVECATTYRILSGSANIMCQSDGSWSTVPQCVKRVCPDKTIDNSPAVLNGIEAGNSVTVTCTDNTFELKGSSTVSCDNYGSWSTDLPTCEKKVCPTISIANSPTDLNGIEAGTTVTVTCTEHYLLTGAAALSCQLDGTWPSLWPQCGELGKCVTQ
eukprot:sb/3462941/